MQAIRKLKIVLKIVFGISILLHAHDALPNTYYSAVSGGFWNSSSTWSTVTYGSPVNTGTYPVTGDIVYIGDGYTILITTSCGASNITVGQGNSGVLQYSGAGTFTLTVSGSINIQTGAKFWYNSNNSRTQNLFISGNFINNGTVDFYYDANDRVNITFNSTGNSIVSGNGTWELNDVTLTKSTSTSNYLEIQSNAFENAIQNFTLTYGTYIHNNSGTFNVSSAGSSFTINTNVIFKVIGGTVNFSPSANFLYLYGALYVMGGNVYVGSTAGNNGIRYNKTGTSAPYLEISSGSMTVYGGISYESGAGSDPFGFKMTGGTLLLNCGTNGTSVEPLLVNDVSGSSFYINNGTIIIQEPNSGAGSNYADFGICGSNGTVTSTGGTVQFGNSSTGNNQTFNFIPYPNAIQPHFKITGFTSKTISLKPSKSSTADFKLLSLYIDTGKIFDVRSILGVNGDTKTMTLTSNRDGIYAFVNNGNFTARSGTVTFNSSANQYIGGNTSTTFNNLTINSSGNIILNSPVNVSNNLNLVSGNIISTSTNIISCLAGATANLGSSNSFVDGPFKQLVASASLVAINLPIGTEGNFHPLVLNVQHTNSTSVSYSARMINEAASGLGLGLPLSLSKVSDVRYYIINRQAVANLSFANIKIYYYANDYVTNYPNLRVAHDDGGSNWVNLSGTGTANTTGTISSTNFSSFNTRFALANAIGGTNPLPLELTKFNAFLVNDRVQLDWITESEIKIDYFTIERSYNLENYSPICRIKSQGINTAVQTYSAFDFPDLLKNIYYRLIVTDQNGKTEVSKPVQVNKSDQDGISIFPNPTCGKNIHIKLNVAETLSSSIHAFDLSGNEIALIQRWDHSKNEYIIDLLNMNSHELNACLLTIESGSHLVNRKIILTKEICK